MGLRVQRVWFGVGGWIRFRKTGSGRGMICNTSGRGRGCGSLIVRFLLIRSGRTSLRGISVPPAAQLHTLNLRVVRYTDSAIDAPYPIAASLRRGEAILLDGLEAYRKRAVSPTRFRFRPDPNSCCSRTDWSSVATGRSSPASRWRRRTWPRSQHPSVRTNRSIHSGHARRRRGSPRRHCRARRETPRLTTADLRWAPRRRLTQAPATNGATFMGSECLGRADLGHSKSAGGHAKRHKGVVQHDRFHPVSLGDRTRRRFPRPAPRSGS